MIEAAAGRTEKERKIPADVLSAMHAAGLFHMLLPASFGGSAVDLVTFNQVIETIAAADASPARCLAQAVASSHAAGFLDPKIAGEVFGAPNALVAGARPRASPKHSRSTAATASPANGDLQAASQASGQPVPGKPAALVFRGIPAYFCFQTMPATVMGKRGEASPSVPQTWRFHVALFATMKLPPTLPRDHRTCTSPASPSPRSSSTARPTPSTSMTR